MEKLALTPRVVISIEALGICWFVSGVLFGLFLRDAQAMFAYFFWSVPFFVAGWLLVGIPLIATGHWLLRMPGILLGLAGAVGGVFIMLLPYLVALAASSGSAHLSFGRSNLSYWTAFNAGIGSAAVMIYRWLLFREINRTPV